MSSAKVAQKPMKSPDPALAERVKRLRGDLGLNQIEFASLLKVTNTQVSEWESGIKKVPSIGHIIEMASLAPSMKDRIWLWEKAGVNLDLIKADFREELRAPRGKRDRMRAVAEQVVSFRTKEGYVEVHYSKGHDAIILRGDHALLIRPRSDNAISVEHKRGTRISTKHPRQSERKS
jgi:transcriptional regulator with XRE-family HTH domain